MQGENKDYLGIEREKIIDFIKNNYGILKLPIEIENSNDIDDVLFARWERYIKLIEKTSWLNSILDNAKKNIELLKKIKQFYLLGNLFSANKLTIKLLKNFYDKNCVCSLDKLFIDGESQQWFRARISDRNVMNKEDMKHIPFNERYKVSNQRYSINGIPCLYLGSSIYDCWEELNRPALDNFWVNRYFPKNVKNVKVLNLSNTAFFLLDYCLKSNDFTIEYVKEFFEIWILQSACSVVVKQQDRIFFEEYIIPQLIMQNLIDMKIDGILYFSVRIKNAYKDKVGWIARNLAIPAIIVDNEIKFSKKIEKIFNLSYPISVGMYRDGNIPYMPSSIEMNYTNLFRTQSYVAISDGYSIKYSSTMFYEIENQLLQNLFSS